MIRFLPSSELSASASAAEGITELSLGYVPAGNAAAKSIRIANAGSSAVTFSFSVNDEDDPNVNEQLLIDDTNAEDVDSITLQPDEITDTLSVDIQPPFDADNATHYAQVIVTTTDGDAYILDVDWETVGAHSHWRRQYPESATDFTEGIIDLLEHFAEPLHLHRYDPIGYDPDDNRVFIDRDRVTGERTIETQSNVCCRLDPLNDRWGYVHDDTVVPCVFQGQDIDFSTAVMMDNSVLEFRATARLYLPAWVEMIPFYQLFATAEGADDAQFKRSVWITQRQSTIWALHNIKSHYFGQDLAYHSADLIAMEAANYGAPTYFNPFALTWRIDASKPYAHYACSLDLFLSSLTSADASGSANPSA